MDQKIYVHFYIGCGGRYYNPGHRTFEDEKTFAQVVKDYYNDYHGAGLVYLNNMTDDGSEMLPDEEWTLTDGQGKVLLEGRDEIEADTGCLDIDGFYDMHSVYEVDDLDDGEVKTILESSNDKSEELQKWLDDYCREKGWDELSMKNEIRTLYVLLNNVWDAADYFKDEDNFDGYFSNHNPRYTDLYLYATREEAEQKAQNLDTGNDIYNDCTLVCGELTEQEILDISGFETIEEFNDALAEPYNPKEKNICEFGKGNVAKKVMLAREIWENFVPQEIIECANYDFDKSLEGCILVFWEWRLHVGYARKCIEVRRAYSDDTEKLLIKEDRVFPEQCDILLTAEEVENADNLREAVREALECDSWKWCNDPMKRLDGELDELFNPSDR